jgi:molecular chaperone DnaK (HSP70)
MSKMQRADVGGLDFGNQTCILGVYRDCTVEILKQSDSRAIPSQITITPTRRYFGAACRDARSRYPESTFSDLKQRISLLFDDPSAVPPPVQVLYQDETIELTTEQLIGALFRHIAPSGPDAETQVGQFVISVPQRWNERQRQFILTAAKLAGIHTLSLLNSTTAAAVCYVHHRASILDAARPTLVMFVDIGDTAMEIAIAKLCTNSVEIVATKSTCELSGQKCSSLLSDFLFEEIQRRYKVDRRALNARALLRFKDAVDLAKRNLSVNPTVRFECSAVTSEVDVAFQLKRDDFEGRLGPTLSCIQSNLDAILRESKIRKADVSGIELFGGCSRIPAIRAVFAGYFGCDRQSSLDVDECVAIGCGLLANSLITHVPLKVTELLNTALDFQVGDAKPEPLFQRGVKIPVQKTIKIPMSEKTTVWVLGEGNKIASCEVTPKGRGSPVSVTVHLSLSNIVNITVPIPAAGKFRSVGSLTESTIERLRDQELCMVANDAEEMRTDLLKNDLDALNFQLSGALDGDLREFFTEDEVLRGRACLEANQEWLDGEGPFPFEELLGRHGQVDAVLQAVQRREREFREVQSEGPGLIGQAQNLLSGAQGDRAIAANLNRVIRDLTEMLRAPKAAGVRPPLDEIKRELADAQAALRGRRK